MELYMIMISFLLYCLLVSSRESLDFKCPIFVLALLGEVLRMTKTSLRMRRLIVVVGDSAVEKGKGSKRQRMRKEI